MAVLAMSAAKVRRKHPRRTAIRTAGPGLCWYAGGSDCGAQAVLTHALRRRRAEPGSAATAIVDDTGV